MIAVLQAAGVTPSLKHFCHSKSRGSARAELHLLRKIAGMPSGPAAALYLSSFMASEKSFSMKGMSWSEFAWISLSLGNRSPGSVSGWQGLLNADLYCCESSSAILDGDDVSVFPGVWSGPILYPGWNFPLIE